MCGSETSSTLGAGRLERRDRLADPGLDAGLHARHEVLARQGDPLAAEGGRRLVVRVGQRRAARRAPARARTSRRARRGRRPRGAASRRRARRARTARSGRGCSRTRRSRSGSRGRRSASCRRSRTARRAGGSSRRCRCRSRAGRVEPPRPPPNRRWSRPGTRSVAHGFAVGPYAECSVEEPIANSSMFVLPRITAPAARSRSVMWAS